MQDDLYFSFFQMVATIINAYLPERTGDVLIIDD